jgi:hypothetical protein
MGRREYFKKAIFLGFCICDAFLLTGHALQSVRLSTFHGQQPDDTIV